MKKFLLLSSILLLTLVLNALYKADYIIYSTESYELRLPKIWTVQKTGGRELAFYHNGKQIGGLEVRGHDKSENLSSLTPNHTQIFYTKNHDSHKGPYIEMLIQQTPPAASGETWVKNQWHFYYLVPQESIAYDLWFNIEEVPRKAALKIAASFNRVSNKYELILMKLCCYCKTKVLKGRII